MKQKFFSRALLVLLVAALMIFTAGCDSEEPAAPDTSADRIAELEAKNAQLQAQIEKLTEQLGSNVQTISLKDWTLDAAVWNDGNGATVTFSAVPVAYAEGQKAALSVRMGELEAESTNCNWDGSAFTGSVELSAADGYSYYCVLTSPDGSQEEVELNSPENPTNDLLVHLGTNLSAYANCVLEDWEATATSLNIKTGYIQCQMPKMTAQDAAPTVASAALVLQLNGEEVGRQAVTLEAGEGDGSYEAAIGGHVFSMPPVEEDYQLNLQLEVILSTGSAVHVTGGSWYSDGGALQMVVG